jgi:hypothetical protein
LALRVVRDVGCLDGGRGLAGFGEDLSGVDLELVGVECYGLGLLLNFQVDGDGALVAPRLAGLEIKEGDGVVGGLDVVGEDVAVGRLYRGISLTLLSCRATAC